MALAIASGVPPQYGLYTVITAGLIIPLLGGSRYSVSGPTAAFVVILLPVVKQYGLSGLLLATFMAGIILVLMGVMRLGRYIEYIPESVTLGFTGGIAIVIAILQLKNFFGLPIGSMTEHFTDKILMLGQHITQLSIPETILGSITLAIMLLWHRLNTRVPAHLPAILTTSMIAYVMQTHGIDIATIGSTFSFELEGGVTGRGIPSILPEFALPWHHSLPTDNSFELNMDTVSALFPVALAIAALGAIKSLLCAVVLDGMSGEKHSANRELVAQGIGNIIASMFGGITATAALARSAANFKSGAYSPISAAVHSVVVLTGLVLLAPLLSYLPMAGMAALLLIVAWNMSEAPKAFHLIRTAPRQDVLVFVVCLCLTVWFDMVIAIATGLILASLLFMKQVADMTRIQELNTPEEMRQANVVILRVIGPLFFAAAEKVFSEIIHKHHDKDWIIISLDAVPLLDAGGVASMNRFLNECKARECRVIFCDFNLSVLKTLRKARFKPNNQDVFTDSSVNEALNRIPQTV